MPADYAAFLDAKAQYGADAGFDPVWVPDALFDFQRNLAEWAVRKGRGAVFANCGLGKTAIQLVWAENVVRHTNRPVLVLAPLGVVGQTVREGEKFGVECVRSQDGRCPAGARVVAANYERLHHFDPADFAGAVCDESSCVKDFAGKRKAAVTEFLRTLPYRLMCTATAAPNDYIELGTHSEALGDMGRMDMLARFFKNDENSLNPSRNHMGGGVKKDVWRFKGHAEPLFWRWVCSWSRAVRKPSDLGFDDGPYKLPPLEEVEVTVPAAVRPGFLFPTPAVTLREQRAEARATIRSRCEKAAECLDGTDPGIAWCHLNDEGRLLAKIIPGAVEVSGSDKAERKEEVFAAFVAGQVRVLVCKPEIGGFGLNFQHCNRMTFFPSHSFEKTFQAVRRCWRFGQTRPVRVSYVASEAEAGVAANYARKAAKAERMFAQLVANMNQGVRANRTRYGDIPTEVPAWLS